MLMIIDINAIADDTHRLGFIQREIPDWKAFYRSELIEKDAVFPGVVRALELMQAHYYTPVFIAGRPESTRGATTRWLADKLSISVDEATMKMRPNEGRTGSSTDFKRETVIALAAALDIKAKQRGVLLITADEELWPFLEEFGIPLRGPECWEHMVPETAADRRQSP